MLRPALFAALTLLVCSSSLEAQSPTRVGFRVVSELDYSRAVGPKVDFEGRLNNSETAVPMSIGVWYPAAAPGRTAVRMSLHDYMLLSALRNGARPIVDGDHAQAREAIRGFARFGLNRTVNDTQLAAILAQPLDAFRDAKPRDGRFPVILVGADGSLASNARLFEALASRGFIVVANASRPTLAALQVTKPAIVLDTRVRDLEYLTDFARKLPFADSRDIGVLGINFDGMAALLYQMKNMRATAVASLDGWEGKAGTRETVRKSAYYDPLRFRAPYFVVQQDEPNASPHLAHDFTVFDELRYGSATHLVLRGLSHGFLVGPAAYFPDLSDEQRASHALLMDRVVAFFEESLKRKPAGQSPQSPLVRVNRHRPALPAAPYAEEVEQIVTAPGGAERLRTVWRGAHAANPGVEIFSLTSLNLFAFRMSRTGRLPDAIILAELGTEAFPRSAAAHNSLGNLYLESADTTQAVRSFENALKLVDHDGALSASERAQSRTVIQQKLDRLKSAARPAEKH